MTKTQTKERLRVLHVISGDLWAGAEAQAYTLLKHLKPLCDVSAVLMNDGELAHRLRDCDIPVTVFDETKLSSWKIFVALRKHLKSNHQNIIHTHRQKENILGSLANTTSLRALCVRTVHGASENSGNWKARITKLIDTWVGRYLQNGTIVVSEDLKAKLHKSFQKKKLAVIHNAIDSKDLNSNVVCTEFKEKEPSKKHIGLIGRLVTVKRADIFLETAELFKKKSDEYHFHIIGDGPLRGQLEEMSRLLKLSELVTFHGHRNDIENCIYSLDALVICSDHEGMPMVALEASALSTPVLAHYIGGLKELELSGNDLFSRNNTPQEYKDLINQLSIKQSTFITKEISDSALEYRNFYSDLDLA